MRQPKFRGFSIETNSWHYGHGWFEVDYTDEYLKEKGIKQQAMLYTEGYPVECELTSMGEFTGLLDSKGKEIYEGDIVSGESFDTYLLKHWGRDVVGKIECYEIKFVRGSFRLCNMKTGDWVAVIDHSIISKVDELIVVGNIYENPELLNN